MTRYSVIHAGHVIVL